MTAILFTSHSGAVSGAERVLLDIVEAFPDGRAFVFEKGDLPARLHAAGLAVTVSAHGHTLSGIRRDSRLSAMLPTLLALGRITLELVREAGKVDLVYANSQKAFTLAAIAALLRRRKLVWHLHDILSPSHFGAVQRKIQTRLANGVACRVVVPSRAAAEAFVQSGGRGDLVAVVPNGVRRSLDPRTKAELRAHLGLPQDRLLAGIFSRLSPWKGQHIVLDALEEANEFTGIFAGAALFGEQDYAESLHAKARNPAFEGRAIFLGQRSDVQLLMQAMDVVVHPSIDPEPFGLTLVEAMLAGVPLVATDAGASAEILDNGRYGRLFSPGDARALAAALREEVAGLKADPDATRTRTEAARERALDLYSVERMNASITALLNTMTGRG